MKMENNQNIWVIQREVSPFGLLNIYYSEKSALMPGVYLATCTLGDGSCLSGIVDKAGIERIPIKKWQITTFFTTKDQHDFCVAFGNPPEDNDQYFHFQYNEQTENFDLVTMTTPKEGMPLISFSSDFHHDDYWLITIQFPKEEKEKYALYRIKEKELATDYFDILDFEDDESNHYAYFCLELKSKVAGEDEWVKLTTLIGFLDEQARFSSYILDVAQLDNDKHLYTPMQLGYHSLSERFQQFKQRLTKHYEDEYIARQMRLYDEVQTLYEHPFYPKEDQLDGNKTKNIKCKIIDFRPKTDK
ncbi:MAG TPA: hypothetical protein IAB56_01825 [Candidatus Scybalousia intestinigallinarum]|nr:hypothetical protein [Candidatus Scybalousia intestinigallinarum]